MLDVPEHTIESAKRMFSVLRQMVEQNGVLERVQKIVIHMSMFLNRNFEPSTIEKQNYG